MGGSVHAPGLYEFRQEACMSPDFTSGSMSRRTLFSALGLAVASSFAVPAAIITATDAEARVGNPASAVSVAGANRRDRRQDRRTNYKKKK
jgi:hypothetical protein